MPESPKSDANFAPALTDTRLDEQLDWESFEAFRDQVEDAIGHLGSVKVRGFEIPNLSNLSPDQAQRYNELQYSLETSVQRWPDIKNADGEVVRLGALKEPQRDNYGNLLENYDIRVGRALLGDDPRTGFDAFIAAGGKPADIQYAIAYMALPAAKRVRVDPKSVAGDLPPEAATD